MYSHAPTGRKSSGGRPSVAHAGRAHEATKPQKPLYRDPVRAGGRVARLQVAPEARSGRTVSSYAAVEV